MYLRWLVYVHKALDSHSSLIASRLEGAHPVFNINPDSAPL